MRTFGGRRFADAEPAIFRDLKLQRNQPAVEPLVSGQWR